MADINQYTQALSERQTPQLNQQAISALSPEQQMAVAQYSQSQEQQEMDRISELIDTKIQQKKVKIQQENAETLQKLREAKTAQAVQEMQRLERKDKLLESMTGTTVNTNMGEMSPAKMMVLSNAGLDVQAASPKVIDTFTNPDGSVKALTVSSGSNKLEVRNLDELEGFEATPEKTVQMGPGQKTAAREQAQLEVDVRSSGWANDTRESWIEANPDMARYLMFPGQQDRAKVSEAQKSLTERFRMALENVYPGEEIFVRGGEKPGFYSTQRGFLRTLPPGVEPQNVVDTTEAEGGEKSKSNEDPLGIR